jgi:dTDP-4-dehydrorhamnose 3,5-epimerase
VNVVHTGVPDVVVLEPKVFGDDRGFFMESWNAKTFEKAGINATFVQDNHSRSAKGVLRGLHYQVEHAQGKLIRVIRGVVFDVAVDLRRSSPCFGKWVGVGLSAENKKMLWIPPGFAHGFLSLEEGSEFLYKCTDYYTPSAERSIIWNDKAIGIDWPLSGMTPQLSSKDAVGVTLAAAVCFP